MCRGCCEYDVIRCKCPLQGTPVGYAVPCCRNALNECDPCIIHPGCSIFENCKRCNNGTWGPRDDFFVKGQYCSECRPGWSGGNCLKCGGVIRKRQGHIVLESYPTNARCEWTLQVDRPFTIDLRFMMLSLEFDHNCRYDYVEVRDGDSMDSQVIGRYCGNERPAPIQSTGNSLHILFVSDGYKNFDGFFAIFQESSACSSSPCLHDGTCVLDSSYSYHCACLAGYTGQRCENVLMCQRPLSPAHGFTESLDLRVGGQVLFHCDPGFALKGFQMATCLLDGTWSYPTPECVPLEGVCSLPAKPAHGDHFLVYGPNDVLIALQYLCYRPYKLQGSPQRTCLANSTWSGSAPTCVKDKEAEKSRCPPLPRLYHGWTEVVPGVQPETVQFFCNHSYALSGSAHRTCQPNGTWTGMQPLCVRACREPKVSVLVRQTVLPPQVPSRKTPVHKLYSSTGQGRLSVSPTRFPSTAPPLPRGFHHLYTHIEYQCTSPYYQHSGSIRRTCLKTGKWSGRHVSCSPVCGKLLTFDPQRPAEARWPWLAAIYRRHGDKAAGKALKKGSLAEPLGKGVVSEEESEAGSATWQLVCSGALVNQRSVVVAAHCVTELGKLYPLDAANVRVTLGKQFRSDLRDTKSLQHLRVSSIVVHPNYDPLVLDSDLAVLKLLDKARIGEHVLPVCLPSAQEAEMDTSVGMVTGWSLLPDQRAGEDERVRVGTVLLGDVVQCERQYAHHGMPIGITDNMLCGRQQPDAGLSNICPADTGGILILPPLSQSPTLTPFGPAPPTQTTPKQEWRLLGLVSFGYDQRDCNPELYTIYTHIANFLGFIEDNMK
ncbi:inactive serine protease PAMR1 [Chanos chanos]|uniref:Inactive serine protease PAMR1 n=1 Tax=Chanos chanos TaxID=29144 RepID=A0A6J2UR75_CHACN|nr:inactive serine protease PAMR1 [Chanos chanos]